MKYLLDTNILIHLLRGNYSVAERIEQAGINNCRISEISKAELLFGEKLACARGKHSQKEKLEQLFELLGNVTIGPSLEFYASEKARLRIAGTPVEDFDLLIGCSAIAADCILVTENTGHMSKIQGLRLENWIARR